MLLYSVVPPSVLTNVLVGTETTGKPEDESFRIPLPFKTAKPATSVNAKVDWFRMPPLLIVKSRF